MTNHALVFAVVERLKVYRRHNKDDVIPCRFFSDAVCGLDAEQIHAWSEQICQKSITVCVDEVNILDGLSNVASVEQAPIRTVEDAITILGESCVSASLIKPVSGTLNADPTVLQSS